MGSFYSTFYPLYLTAVVEVPTLISSRVGIEDFVHVGQRSKVFIQMIFDHQVG
jgi:hypothetical protein